MNLFRFWSAVCGQRSQKLDFVRSQRMCCLITPILFHLGMGTNGPLFVPLTPEEFPKMAWRPSEWKADLKLRSIGVYCPLEQLSPLLVRFWLKRNVILSSLSTKITLASMFIIYNDMRVARGRQMASGLVDSKLEDCHMRTTVSPTQVNWEKVAFYF